VREVPEERRGLVEYLGKYRRRNCLVCRISVRCCVASPRPEALRVVLLRMGSSEYEDGPECLKRVEEAEEVLMLMRSCPSLAEEVVEEAVEEAEAEVAVVLVSELE